MSGSAFVVDNSIVMSWCFQDERNAFADTVLDRLREARAFVPAIWTLEVVNVLLVAERHERLKPADSARFLDLLGRLPIQVEQGEPEKGMGAILRAGRKTYPATTRRIWPWRCSTGCHWRHWTMICVLPQSGWGLRCWRNRGLAGS